ncbi:MAG: orotidine-5'-phosphate decarboxylase, partial [Smithellaceae bacterium]
MTNTSNRQAADKLIFALDAADYDEALSWIDLLSGHVGMFKVGKELFTACGPKIIEEIKRRGQKVFLDLKFHDIPNTVARAACAALRFHVDMFNVHAAGGSAMIRETANAVSAAAGAAGVHKPVMLAVTVLTSLNDDDLAEIGFQKSAAEMVIHLARLAQTAGAGGVVASPREIALLRQHLPDDFVIVTPGIRASNAAPSGDDQK